MGFSATAIVTIAVGLATTSALFAIIDHVLLKPLPFIQPNRIVAIWETVPEWKKIPVLSSQWDRGPISIPQYRALDAAGAFAATAIWSEEDLPLTFENRAEYVRVTRASASMLGLLGVSPVLGRYFSRAEDRPNSQPVAMVSYEAWQRRYGRSPQLIGHTVQIDHQSFMVVGILPSGLTLDAQEDASEAAAGGAGSSEFWIPAGRDSTEFDDATRKNFRLIARLWPGEQLARATYVAQAALHPVEPEHTTRGTRVEVWQTDQTKAARGPLVILFASTCFLLLIACANVALLTLGEAGSRHREVAMRVALGAGRARLIRQYMVESAAMCVGGGLLAVPLAWLCAIMLLRVAPPEIAATATARPDGRVLVFGLVATFVSALLSGTLPALVLASTEASSVVNVGSNRSTARNRLQQLMIGVQIGVATVLLLGTMLLLRTLQNVDHIAPGFDGRNLLAVDFLVPQQMWGDTLRTRMMYTDLIAGFYRLPSVRSVTGASEPPFVGRSSVTLLRLPDEPRPSHSAQYRFVLPGYFAAMGIPLRAGRDFAAAGDGGGAPVVLISQALAQRDFSTHSPIGQRIQVFHVWRTIVGVVNDVHFAKLSEDLEPTVYMPFAQAQTWNLTLLIRAEGDLSQTTTEARRIVAEVAPTVAIHRIEVVESAIRRSFVAESYRAALMTAFSAVAAFLAVIGIYGVAFRDGQTRRREMAIRLSLGASRRSVLRILLGSTSGGLAGGLGAGLMIALLAAPQLRPYLFDVQPRDPAAYAAILSLVGGLCLAATWLAVRTVQEVNLALALRED